jgi:hypothetical protein
MNSFSPTAQGFRLIFRRPAIPMAEIAWRWSFVVALWFLTIALFFEYIDTLRVRTLDRVLLATRHPLLIWRALERIFHGSAFRFTEAGVILAIALVVAWVLLGSFGRAATVNSVLEDFGLNAVASRRFSSLVALHWLRAAVALAAFIGIAGAALLASSVWASTHLSAADAFRLFGLIIFLVWLAWAVLNWWLSVASIFVVSEASSALASIALTGRFCQRAPGPVLATALFFGLVHLGALVAAWGAAFGMLSVAPAVGVWPVLFLGLIVVVGYCGIADFLYTGRLAAYVAIIRRDEMAQMQPSTGPSPIINGSTSSKVDQNELILSDVPLTAN